MTRQGNGNGNGHSNGDNPLPQNLEAERSILGAILLDNAALSTVAKELPPDQTWFASAPGTKSPNGVIYSAMLAIGEAGNGIDQVTLVDYLMKAHALEAAGGAGYVMQLVDGVPRTPLSHAVHWCQIVREKAQLRRALHFSNSLQARISDGQTEAAEVFAELKTFAGSETHFAGPAGNGHVAGRTLQQIMEQDFPVPEHLIEGLVPRGSSVMFYAKPHSLKSWLTLALTLRASVEGSILGGKLAVENPVRTLLLSIEDPPTFVKQRLQALVTRPAYASAGFDPSRFKIIMRDEVPGFHLPNRLWFDLVVKAAADLKADHIILDVVRKIVKPGMDLNKPSDTAEFVHCLEELQDATGATVTICHHEKKSASGIMEGASGSISLVSWSKVVGRLGQKHEEKNPRHLTTVELETDNAWVSSLEPMRLILDVGAHDPLRLEDLAEGIGLATVKDKLTDSPSGWSLRDLMEVEDCSKPTAWRKLQAWMKGGEVEIIRRAKSTKGGLARYRFLNGQSFPTSADA